MHQVHMHNSIKEISIYQTCDIKVNYHITKTTKYFKVLHSLETENQIVFKSNR